MSFSLERYQAHKNKLLQIINQASFLLDEINQQDGKKNVLAWRKEMMDSLFQIVVVGEFSRGKSTFINALLGKKILPSSAKPTTTILNTISYSHDPFIKLHFQNNQGSRQITEKEFAKLVAPKDPKKGDPLSEKEFEEKLQHLQSIHHAEIGHPLHFCSEGVKIIDTPGTNDLDPFREQVTNSIIPNADAAIFLLSASKILTESEITFLRDRLIKNDIQKIFIVINFKDDLKGEADYQKVINYAKEHLPKSLNNPKIHLVSAKQALDAKRKSVGDIPMNKFGPIEVWDFEKTGFIELEKSLADFLQFDRGVVKLQKPIRKLQKQLEDSVISKIQFEKRTLNLQIENLQEKVDAFKPKIQNMKVLGLQSLKQMETESSKEELQFKGWYEAELYNISSKALGAFDANRHSTGAEQLGKQVEKVIAPLERDLHLAKTKYIEESFKRIIEKSTASLNQEWAKIDRDFENLVKPSSDSKEISQYLGQEDSSSPRQMVIFEEIIEDLGSSFSTSTSLIGKVFAGAGIALTVVAYGLFELGRSFFSWLFGEDPKVKMRNNLINRFQASKTSKLSESKQEWKAVKEQFQKQIQKVIDSQIHTLEGQLNQLVENNSIEENQIKQKLELMELRERKALQITGSLKELETNLLKDQQQAVLEEVY